MNASPIIHDPLDDAFAQFVAETAEEIVPPGPAAARRVGARRHTTRVAAAWLAVLLVGAGSALAATRDRHPDSVKPASPIGPLSTKFDRRVLAENWLTLRDTPDTYFYPNWVVGGDEAAWMPDQPISGPGRYRLAFDCVLAPGAGHLDVTFAFVPDHGHADAAHTVATCDGENDIHLHTLDVQAHGPGHLSLSIRVDPTTEAEAGIGWRIEHPDAH